MTRQLSIALTTLSSSVKVSPIFTRSDFPENGVIQIESELIRYENTTGDEFIQVTRGYLGTTPAAHPAGIAVDLYTTVPRQAEINSAIELLSPATLVADVVDTADIIKVATVMADTLVLTLPSPSDTTESRLIVVSHKTASTGTLSINGTDLTAGQYKLFVWDGSAWNDVPSAGGSGATQALDNLASTAINVDLLPATDSTIKLGDETHRFTELNIIPNGLVKIDANHSFLFNGQGGTGMIMRNPLADTTIEGFTSVALVADQNNAGLTIIGAGDSFALDMFTNGNEIVFDDVAGEVIINATNYSPAVKFDNSAVAGNTRMFLYDADSGSLQRIKVTANDAVLGVTGRVLYVDDI